MEFKVCIRLALLFGRNPRYVNSFTGKEAKGTAAVIADGPGAVVTSTPCLIAAITNSAPGSLKRGIPASDTNAMSIDSRSFIIPGSRC